MLVVPEGAVWPSPLWNDELSATRYHCDLAYLGAGSATAASDVAVTVEDGRFVAVEPGVARTADAAHLRGLTLPGFANAHSHAFHRVLRGRAERPGTFWTWRDEMYTVAAVLDPALYHRLARAVFAEMVLAGFSAVGEFHYLHHGPGGTPYDDPNEMGRVLVVAAADAGIRITVLDTCYLTGGPGTPPEGVQQRFCDGDVGRWAERAEALASVTAPGRALVGAAAHSLRAVAPGDAGAVALWALGHDVPFHVHVSEQRAENDTVRHAYGAAPVDLLDSVGALGRSTTVVHATHLHPAAISALGRSGTAVCMCPTTERALGDGIGKASTLAREGSPIVLGTDSHAVIDPFEEMRALELDDRLATGERGRFETAALLDAATTGAHASIGWHDAGRITPGAPADLVTVSLSSVRLAGATPDTLVEHVVFGAGPPDVTDVVVSGRRVVEDGRHLLLGDVAAELSGAIAEVVRAAARA